jgi:hypothetical protein
MNFESAAERLLECRRELATLDAQYKIAKARWVERQTSIENWFTARAQEEGLHNVPTQLGTAYWSTHSSATVGSREALFSYCKEHNAWDLVESRASSTAVKAYIEAHGAPPPGIDFKSRSVFNFRAANTAVTTKD